MIKKPTVFILGACASKPYGYPLGADLGVEFGHLIGDQKFHNFLANSYLKTSINEFEKFFVAFKNSTSPSIDRFLEHNPAFLEIGKHALAYYFYTKDELDIRRNETYGSDWYQTLFHKTMYEPNFSNFLANRVTFVSFNYDVTLERFFRNTIRNIYKTQLDEEGLNTFFHKIRIYHLHGNIRGFSWQNPNEGEFDKIDLNYEAIKKLGVTNIKLTRDGWGPDVYWMREVFSNAERVIFLGFAFHPDNVAKFQFDWPGDKQPKIFESTSVGMTNAEENVINRDLCASRIVFRQMDSQKLLKERFDFLTQ